MFIWQILQNLVGLAMLAYFKITKQPMMKVSNNCNLLINIIPAKFKMGVSLGKFIFISEGNDCSNTIMHEIGHAKQSMMLGPLYLFVVGIPSAILNLRTRKNKELYSKYYKTYPENWADKMGGVTGR